MVGSSGTAAAAPPFSRPRMPPSPGFAFASVSTSFKTDVSGAPETLGSPFTPSADHPRRGRAAAGGDLSIDTFTWTATPPASQDRFSDLTSTPSSAGTATPTTVLKVRPALRLNRDAPPHAVSVSSSPPRRDLHPHPTAASAITSPPLSAASDAPYSSRPAPERPRVPPASSALSNSEAPVLPDLNLRRGDSYDLSKIPELAPLSPPARSPAPPGPSSPPRRERQPPQSSPRAKPRVKEHHRTHSQKTMLASALQKANTAVTLDNAENYEGAMEAYGDACVLLNQVMVRAAGEEDRRRLQTIKETYMQRIEELQALPPRKTLNERELPPRPLTEEFTDEASMFTTEDDESTLGPSTRTTTATEDPIVPPRKDSLFSSREAIPAAQPTPPLPRSMPSNPPEDIVPAPLQALRSPGSPRSPTSPQSQVSPRTQVVELPPEPQYERRYNRFTDHRESFTFGAAALSPKYSLRKELDFGVRRSSDASSTSSQHRSNPSHSRDTSEISTSWLNTIDESGSSASGEFSPGWMRKPSARIDSRLDSIEQEQDLDRHPIFDDDFDTQLDAAVEAAYDDGYEVDYSYDREEEFMMMQSPRLNVERAKERVRQVEREMEMANMKEKERRIEREQQGAFSRPRRESDLDFYDDGDDDDESEEERMLEEMTRGYTLDFDFNLDTKTALPRESASTTYSDSTFQRGSVSSGYSSGTTWGSSMSGHLASSTSLTTVAEAPSTPPPLPTPVATTAPSPAKVGSSPSKLPPPPPALPAAGLAISKPPSVRSRRLSALSESLEPLKIETAPPLPLSTTTADAPSTVVRGSSPPSPSPPTQELPPLPSIPPPLNVPPRSTPVTASRPGTSGGQKDSPITESPESKDERLTSPPPPPTLELPQGGLSSVPLTKAVSDHGVSVPRSGSPAKFAPKIPGLRQIQSSASLRSRNVTSPEVDSPGIPGSNLFASSSTSNLRKPYARSITPATPGLPSSMMPPPTAGLPTSGMNLFENKVHSPDTPSDSGAPLSSNTPYPLEPCPPEPLSKPYWLMRSLYQTIAHPRGGYISSKLFVPREVWSIKGVKIKSVDDKISACDLVTAALMKLSTVNQEDMTSMYEEMQSLESVLDRAQALLTKRLGSEVGGAGARAMYGLNENSPPDGSSDMITTKVGNIGGGKNYFSLRKLRTKASGNTLGGTFASSNASTADFSAGSLPMATSATDVSQQPKRDLASVSFTGPHAAYISALARLFDSAQLLDNLSVFDEDSQLKRAPGMVRIGLELSQRHAAEFFGLYICRFVLADIALLLDKFVKRGSEWVGQ